MQLIEDDAEVNPPIPQSQISYVRALSDSHENYARFFDALLISRPSHAAFFRDLRGFRRLPTTIQVLRSCNPDDESVTKEQRKLYYRDVTNKFLGSRFAHPWCRQAMGGTSGSTMRGGWSADWAATGRKMSREQQEQEDKLHRLLLPLWISFRHKMFPGEEAVQEWWAARQLDPSAMEALSPVVSLRNSVDLDHDQMGSRSNKGALFSEDDAGLGDDDSDDAVQRQQAGSAATGVLRLAAAGMMINSLSRMQKWKLKRELKKRMK